MGLRDDILNADDLTYVDEVVPEWNHIKVRITSLSGTERNKFEAKMVALRRGTSDIELRLDNYHANLVVHCLLDPETGERIFSDADAAELGKKSGAVIARLFNIAQSMSGMGPEARQEAEENLENDPNESSTSG